MNNITYGIIGGLISWVVILGLFCLMFRLSNQQNHSGWATYNKQNNSCYLKLTGDILTDNEHYIWCTEQYVK